MGVNLLAKNAYPACTIDLLTNSGAFNSSWVRGLYSSLLFLSHHILAWSSVSIGIPFSNNISISQLGPEHLDFMFFQYNKTTQTYGEICTFIIPITVVLNRTHKMGIYRNWGRLGINIRFIQSIKGKFNTLTL